MGDLANSDNLSNIPIFFILLINTISTSGFLKGVSIACRMEFDTIRVQTKEEANINQLP
jgi:hypothetical protein